ncbi:MAG: hypothetical protein BAJALOKI2v1_670016 [Promethearchaeota archaeon]|nr:MAG: hypothetical protein BAJALOKI2v1_670016 [Candidatus Lokiarchaeota archaeon]
MLNEDSLKQRETSIANILHKSIKLFRRVGNYELAEKWSKILKNYYTKKEHKH